MFKLNKTLIAAGIALLSTGILYGCSEPQVLDFKYKGDKSITREYEVKSEDKATSEIDGNTEKQQMTITLGITEEITDITDKNERKISYRIKNAKIARVEDNKMQETPLPNLNDQVFNFKYDERGKLLETNGTEVDPNSRDAQGNPFVPSIQFDTKPIKVGESWESKIESKNAINPITTETTNVKTTYTFAGYVKEKTNKYAKIDEKTQSEVKVVMDPKAMKSEDGKQVQNPPKITRTVSGTTEGYVLFDVKKGFIAKVEKTSKLTSVTSLVSNENDKKSEKDSKDASKTMKGTIESKLTIDLVDNTAKAAETPNTENKDSAKETEKK